MKTAAKGPPFCSWVLRLRCRRSLGFLGALRHRPGVEALGLGIAVDELDHGNRGAVAVAEAGLEDAHIAALAVLVAGTEDAEELLALRLVLDLSDRLPAGME